MRILARNWAAASLMLLLAGCFVSQTQLIGEDAAVLPSDGDITLCLDAEDPCLTLGRSDVGYLAVSPDAPGEDVLVRFAPLVQAAGRQVFIAEAGMRTEDGTAYIYGVARRLAQPDARGATMQLAALDCADISDAALEAFEAGGGIIETGKVQECRPVSLVQLRETLLAVHRADLSDDDWWLERGEDF